MFCIGRTEKTSRTAAAIISRKETTQTIFQTVLLMFTPTRLSVCLYYSIPIVMSTDLHPYLTSQGAPMDRPQRPLTIKTQGNKASALFPCDKYTVVSLTEITVQQPLEGAAVTGLVFAHLVDGVVNGVVAQLLRFFRQHQLALGGAALGLHAGL